MPLPLPNLDDRDFEQLVDEARQRIMRSCPEWTDFTPGDPGVALLEAFAYLTETMIYRLNRLPEKAYVAFLQLLGVRLQPPAAAITRLVFTRERATDQPVEIPRGTRVTLNRPTGAAEPPVFVTTRAATIAAGETTAEALACHAELIEAELAGVGTGQPGLSVTARRPPLIAPIGDELDLVVGVEATPEERRGRIPAIQHDGKAYRVWREGKNFTDLGPDRFVYVADRMMGTITFAPAARLDWGGEDQASTLEALAEIPPANREIRLWYRRGGGPDGNVPAQTLVAFKDPIPGLQVTNPRAATGGLAAEPLENALIRGPQQLHALERAVTQHDYELVALNSSRAVARARAITRAALWAHAPPGSVEVLLVPRIPEVDERGGRVTATALQEHETDAVLVQIQQALDERRPLGTSCAVKWARYKTVRVLARVAVRPEEDRSAVKQRVLERLHQTINPLPTRFSSTGWRFGQPLRVSNVYDVALAEPGVRWVDRIRLLVERSPERAVDAVAADPFQRRTWYAGAAGTLFRSLNDGEGWEPVGDFPGEEIVAVEPHPQRAGLIAVATHLPDGGSRLHISHDCGETWDPSAPTVAFEVHDLAWSVRGDQEVLFFAADAGLYEVTTESLETPVQVVVDPTDQGRAFYAVAAATDARGEVSVAAASQRTGGVFLSSSGGRAGTFRAIGLRGEDIRVLRVQPLGPRSILWAGATVESGEEPGKGCFSWELRGSEDPPEGWQARSNGWSAGSCRALAFQDATVLAASHRGGVLRLDATDLGAEWQRPNVRCGLPLRDPGRFHPVAAVAVDPGGRIVMAGGPEGVFRSDDKGDAYRDVSRAEFEEAVPLPETWLFCSGEHEIDVVSDDEAR